MMARPLCALEAPQFRADRLVAGPPPVGLTKKQKVEQWLTDVVLHEIGHTLVRLFLDPAAARGRFIAEPNVGDYLLGPALFRELEGVLFNRDGLRSYASRREMVDILKKILTSTPSYHAD
jgi:hypothetical protein